MDDIPDGIGMTGLSSSLWALSCLQTDCEVHPATSTHPLPLLLFRASGRHLDRPLQVECLQAPASVALNGEVRYFMRHSLAVLGHLGLKALGPLPFDGNSSAGDDQSAITAMTGIPRTDIIRMNNKNGYCVLNCTDIYRTESGRHTAAD